MGKYRIRYKRNKHQKEFANDVVTPFLHLSTGFGGGKTYSLAMKNFDLSRLNTGIAGGCVVTDIADYKKDLLPIMEEILDTNRIRYRYHQTDKWWLFPWSKGKLFIATAEKKIRGPNWGFCTFNEVTLMKHERYKEGIGRVRVKHAPFPQIASSGTPEGTDHWLYEQFVETPMRGSRIIYGDTRDNLMNLHEMYIPALESSYDEIMLDAYLRGMFVNMKGNRFYYAYDPKRNDSKAIERLIDEPVHVSLDYNVQPMVATLWHVLNLKNAKGIPLIYPSGAPMQKAVAFGQIVIEDGADTMKMSEALEARGLDKETTIIYPDPAGKNRSTQGAPDNTQLRNAGWQLRVKLSAPRFRKRQLAVNNLLGKGLIQMHPTECKALKKDCEAVTQDQATYEKLKDNPKLTHASDGMDYFVDIVFPLSGEKPNDGSVKYR